MSEMRGLYLVEPHGRLIASGEKTAVAKSRPFGLEGKWILVSGKLAYGVLALGEPEEVGLAEFDKQFDEHRVSRADRRRWWPEAERLCLYKVAGFEGYLEPRGVVVPAGVQTVMREVRFDVGTLSEGVLNHKDRANDTLARLSNLPDKFVWIPDFVSLTGSQIYAKDGREPNDVDVVLKAGESRGGNGFELRLPVDAAFALKLERALAGALGAENVQYTGNPYGANWDNIPLYSLCLVRKPELKVVEVSSEESEFAAQQYKARTLSASVLERLLRGATAETRKQAKRSFDENKVVPGRMFVPLKPLRPAPEGERQLVSTFYKFIEDNLSFPLFVSAKRDGARHQVHRKGGKVTIYSDDGRDNTADLPRLVKRLEKFGKGDWVIDSEFEEWLDGQHFPREAAAGAVHSGEDEHLAINIFRILFWDGKDLHNEPFESVWEIMAKIPVDTKSDGRLRPLKDGPINLIPHYKVNNLAGLKKRVESTAYKPGVEGVVIKRADGTYPLDGQPGTKNPVSLKWHKAFAAVFVALKSVKTKTPGVFNIWYGIPV